MNNGQQLLGISGLQSNAGGGVTLNITVNSDDCGCVPPPDGGGTGVVRWEDITGKPTCILDCEVLLQYIQQNGLFNLRDSSEILVEVDGQGINRLFLIDRGIIASTYGDANSTVRVTVNEKGIVTAIEQVDIQLEPNQVNYTNATYPSVTNLKEMLDQLVLIASRQSYEHNQTTAATTWNIAHNMGKRPSVTILDGAGDLSFGRIAYTDLNNITLTFSEAITGTAYLN